MLDAGVVDSHDGLVVWRIRHDNHDGRIVAGILNGSKIDRSQNVAFLDALSLSDVSN